MKHLFFVLMIAITVVLLPYPGVALAADAQNGAKLFTVHCAACHRGGRNVIQADKTLKLDALQTNNIASVEAITAQIERGKMAMPSFKEKLSAEEMEDVATYVLNQAEQGW